MIHRIESITTFLGLGPANNSTAAKPKRENFQDKVEISELGKNLAAVLNEVENSIGELDLDGESTKLILQAFIEIMNLDITSEEKMTKMEELLSSLKGLTTEEIIELINEYIESIGGFGYKSD